MTAPRLTLAVVCAVQLLAGRPLAQETIDHDTYGKIRREAMENSHVLKTLHVLTDQFGPRLTGSPNLKDASDWVVGQATRWGLENVRLEPWDFGRPGWVNLRVSAFVVAPITDTLIVEALAWTPGTNGNLHASAVQVTPPGPVTKE